MATKKAETKEEPTTALATTGPTAITTPDYGDLMGSGFENMDASYTAIPWINVLQQMSPMVAEAKVGSNGVEARSGRFQNSVTNEVLESPLLIVPATIQRKITRWVHRDKGGGFLGQLETNDPEWAEAQKASKEFGSYQDREGNELVDTFYLFGVLVTDTDVVGPFAMALASTKIKPTKNWIAGMQQLQTVVNGRRVPYPLFANLTSMSTESMRDRQNRPYHNVAFAPAKTNEKGVPSWASSLLEMSDQRFLAAYSIKQALEVGKAGADMNAERAQRSVTGDGEDPPF